MKKQEIWRELAQRELARRSFAEYLAYVQGRMWKRTRMAEFLAGRVQAFLETETGHAYDILLIETPPQHGKSMTVTESVPSWYLGKHPEARIIMASYNEGFAERFLRRNNEKIRRFGKNLCCTARTGLGQDTGAAAAQRVSAWNQAGRRTGGSA